MDHTPGPWKAQGNAIWTDTDTTPFRVADVTVSAPMNNIDHKANANLIAAAPELLEACEYVLELIEQHSTEMSEAGVPQGTMQNWLEVAIKKAKGI